MMEKWKYNDRYIQSYKIEAKTFEGLEDLIFKAINTRPKFSVNNNEIIIPRIFSSIVGLKDDENIYYDKLFNLKSSLKKYNELFLFFEDVKVEYPTEILSSFNNAWNKVKLFYDIEADNVVSILEQHNLFPAFPNKFLSTQLKENLSGIIDYYFEINQQYIDEEEFKLILLNVIYFLNTYFYDLYKNFDYININPKILYYGNISKEWCYTLIYLSSLGTDIIYINPYTDEILHQSDPFFQFYEKVEQNRKLFPKPFPIGLNFNSVKTETLLAQNELNNYLYNEETGLYKAGQLTNLNINCIHLKTTYDEIFILGKESPTLRPGFKQDGDNVIIPTIFAKIMGVEENRKSFNDKLSQISTLSSSYVYIPENDTNSFEDYNYYQMIKDDIQQRSNKNESWFYDINKLMLSNAWGNFKQLPYNTQKTLAEKICLIINKKIIKQIPYNDIEFLSTILNYGQSEEIVNFLRKYDFKNNSLSVLTILNRALTDNEIILFTLFNLMGIDIIIVSTAMSSDIEQYLPEGLVDIHFLPESDKNYKYKKKFFSNEKIINKW